MLCANLLSNEDTVMQLAQQMVAMAQYYNFDGWLVNIENPINVSLLKVGYHFHWVCLLSIITVMCN